MGIRVGDKHGKLSVVRRWGFRWRAHPFVGQPAFLCVCDCGAQVTLPEGAIIGTPTRIAACGECQPEYLMPSVPETLADKAGHKLVDGLLAAGLSPLRAYFEYTKRRAQ